MDTSLDGLLIELLAAGTEGTQPEPLSTRARITQAALELFAEYSYEAATTKAIAQRAGVTERTLFKHFPSKELLFARTVFPAVLQAIAPMTVQPVMQMLDSYNGDVEATLRAVIVERIAYAKQHPALMTMIVRELLLRPAFRAAIATFFVERGRPHLEEFVARARASGQIRDLPPDAVLRAIGGQIVTYIITGILFAPDQAWGDPAEVEQIVFLIMHGIGAPGRTTGAPPQPALAEGMNPSFQS